MTAVNALLGQALVLAGLAVAAAGAVVGFVAGRSGSADGWAWTRRLAYAYGACMVAATVVMEYALLTHDFSVRYVAQVGSRSSPTYITIVSLWSSLEGSILFWGCILGIYIALATWLNGERNAETMPYATATWLAVGAFFCFLMAGPANPFWPAPNPVPADGPGPNALLQNHLLMIVHPPTLYLGYVGMTIPFGIAIGALLRGTLAPGQLSLLRSWLVVPFGFLSVGITLGGWWAYEVLGWGGYWAWDPVENASLLPWLTATTALHAALLPARRGMMKGWTITLVIVSFLLTLLGTFMTRSGVFNSVHSFSQSDIGPTILAFLALATVFSVVLLALRVDMLESEGAIQSMASREVAFLVNNLVFVALTFIVLLGTTYPLLAEAIKGVKVSAGEPYYNFFAVPLGAALLFLMGVGPALPWGRANAERVRAALLVPLICAAAGLGLGLGLGLREGWPLAVLTLAGFSGAVTVREMALPFRAPDIADAFSRGRRRFSGYVVHAGIIIMIVAIAMSHAYRQEKEMRVSRGQSVPFAEYTLRFVETDSVKESNRTRQVAVVAVEQGGKVVATLLPALNIYPTMSAPVGSPDVASGLTHDLYVSLMSIDDGGASIGIHVFRNPLIAWLWIGAGVVTAGALLAALPQRRRGVVVVAVGDVIPQVGK